MTSKNIAFALQKNSYGIEKYRIWVKAYMTHWHRFYIMSGFPPLRIQREILCRTSATPYDNYVSGQINCQQTRKVDY